MPSNKCSLDYCSESPSTIHANSALNSMMVMMITTARLSGPGFLPLDLNMYVVCGTGLTVMVMRDKRV